MHTVFLGKLKLACRTKTEVGVAIGSCFVKDVSVFFYITYFTRSSISNNVVVQYNCSILCCLFISSLLLLILI